MKAAILGLVLAVACSSSSHENETENRSPIATGNPYGPCYLVTDQQAAPSSGTCWRVQASSGNILAHCYPPNGPAPTNEVITSGQLDRFDVQPGGCFEYYVCGNPAPNVAPTVTVCP